VVTGELNKPGGLVSEKWSAEKTKDLHLDLLLGPSALSYLIYSCNPCRILRAGSINAPDDTEWKSDELAVSVSDLKKDLPEMSSVCCTLAGLPFTLMPAGIAGEEKKKESFRLLHGSDENEINLKKIDAGNLLILSEQKPEWEKILSREFPKVVFNVLIEKQIARASELISAYPEGLVSIYQDAHFMQAVVYTKSKGLMLANSYATESAEDTLYFLSHFFNTFSLDNKKTRVELDGRLGEGDLLQTLLSNYFENIGSSGFGDKVGSEGFELPALYPILRMSPCAS
jgi:hypothetical protein